MIEMRWVQHGDGHEDDPIERTLQFREWPGALGEGVEPDWIDVETVKLKWWMPRLTARST
mgnify:CR=1 FL=1